MLCPYKFACCTSFHTLFAYYRRRSSEPSYHPIFGQIFDFEIFNHFDSGHSVQHIVKFSVSNLV